jgi:hypothetical protein
MVLVGIKGGFSLVKEKSEGGMVFLTYLLAGVIMMLAVTVYWTEDGVTGYAYMGRYYEWLFIPIMVMGMLYCVNGQTKNKLLTLSCIGGVSIIIFLLKYGTAERLTPQGFNMTGMASSSLYYVLYHDGTTEDYRGMILRAGFIAIVSFLAMIVLSMHKQLKYSLPVILAAVFLLSDFEISKKLHRTIRKIRELCR